MKKYKNKEKNGIIILIVKTHIYMITDLHGLYYRPKQ